MEDLPPNSHKSKEARPAKKRVEAVVTNPVTIKKKGLGARFRETFVKNDARSVFGYVLMDVIVPSTRDTIVDAIKESADRAFYGESRTTHRTRRGGPAAGYTNYNRYANPAPARRDEPRAVSKQARSMHDFSDIRFQTRVEADNVLDHMYTIFGQYDVVTVMDFYDLANITVDYPDAGWGWTDLSGSGTTRTSGGDYILKLPPPRKLND